MEVFLKNKVEEMGRFSNPVRHSIVVGVSVLVAAAFPTSAMAQSSAPITTPNARPSEVPVIVVPLPSSAFSTNAKTINPTADMQAARIPDTFPSSLRIALTNLLNVRSEILELRQRTVFDKPVAISDAPRSVRELFERGEQCTRQLAAELKNDSSSIVHLDSAQRERVQFWHSKIDLAFNSKLQGNGTIDSNRLRACLSASAGMWRAWIPIGLETKRVNFENAQNNNVQRSQ